MTCECGAGFCGLCLIDTNGDAHAHVRVCPLMPTGAAGVFHSAVVISSAQGIVKKRRLVEYLKQINNVNDRVAVLENLTNDLKDLKIGVDTTEIM